MVTQSEAMAYRTVTIMHPFTDVVREYHSDFIHSISEKGVVIATTKVTRSFYPWERVTSFSYHIADDNARRTILGVKKWSE